MEVFEDAASLGDHVDIRRPQDGMMPATKMICALLIRYEKQDIWPLLHRRTFSCRVDDHELCRARASMYSLNLSGSRTRADLFNLSRV